MYCKRNIDLHLLEWSKREVHKPLLLRGARQVGKSSAEIDYIVAKDSKVLPVEVKADRQGGIKAFGTSCTTKN